MRLPGFIGSSNEEQSYIAGQARTINWYVATLAESAPAQRALFPTPGVTLTSSATSGPGRAHEYYFGREWAVEAGTFYEILEDGTWTSRGSVAIDGNPATISSNGDGGGELFITSGANGYIYDIDAATLTQIANLNGLADQGDQIDGYFLALDVSTSTVYFSVLNDGTTWTVGANFFQRSAAPDGWVAMKVLNGAYIWLFGSKTSEVWYNAGTFPNPFQAHPSGRGIEYGCAAAFSPAVVRGTMFWLGSSSQGRGMVLSTPGFSPNVVSTPAVERALQSYTSTNTAAAVGDSYDEDGHVFYLAHVPGGITWTYDLTTREWHERGTWISEDNDWIPWRARHHTFAFGKHRWLDSETGALYEASVDNGYDVDGRPLRRLRRGPAIISENERVFYDELELLMDVGVGTAAYSGRRLPESLFTGASFAEYYEFETNAKGLLNQSDLTLVNNPTFVDGVYNLGASLERVTDNTDSPHFTIGTAGPNAIFFDPGTSDFVVACKVKFSELHAIQAMGAKGGNTTYGGWSLRALSTGAVQAFLKDTVPAAVTVTSAASVIKDNMWYDIVLSVDRTTDVATIYVNQTSVATGDVSSLGSISSENNIGLFVGSIEDTDYPMSGILDQWAFVVGRTWDSDDLTEYAAIPAQGSNPQVMMRYSNDGGKTWGIESIRTAGKIGEYGKRVRWTRLGSARKRVFEVTVSDPIPYRLVDAFVKASPSTAQRAS